MRHTPMRPVSTLLQAVFLVSSIAGCTAREIYLGRNSGALGVLSAPIISMVMSKSGIDNATITWSTDVPANAQVNFAVQGSQLQPSPLNSTLLTAHSVTLSGLAANTTYQYSPVSAAGGLVSSSTLLTFTTQPALLCGTPGNEPEVSAVTVPAATITSTTATITWMTDVLAQSQVNYGTSTLYGSSQPDLSDATSHSMTLPGLTASTTYHFQITSTDASGGATNGQCSQSADYQFTTAAGNAAPNITVILPVVVTATTAAISITTDVVTAPSEVDYRSTTAPGGKATDTTTGQSHTINLSGLSAGMTYTYQVFSTGTNGVQGSTSATLSFSTTGTAPPNSISNVAATSGTYVATVTANSGNPSTAIVKYGTTPSYGSTTAPTSTLATSLAVQLTGLQPTTQYFFEIDATDGYGSVASGTGSFTTGSALAATITHLYAVMLGRSPSASDFSNWEASSCPSYGIAGSEESAAFVIKQYFLTITGQPVTGTQASGVLESFADNLGHYAVGVYPPVPITGTDSYLTYDASRVKTNIAATVWANYGNNCTTWVSAMYSALTGVTPTSATLATYIAQCNSEMAGGAPVPTGAAFAIASSQDGLNKLVAELYLQILKRPGESAGIANWAALPGQGWDYLHGGCNGQNMMGSMATSSEFAKQDNNY